MWTWSVESSSFAEKRIMKSLLAWSIVKSANESNKLAMKAAYGLSSELELELVVRLVRTCIAESTSSQLLLPTCMTKAATTFCRCTGSLNSWKTSAYMIAPKSRAFWPFERNRESHMSIMEQSKRKERDRDLPERAD